MQPLQSLLRLTIAGVFLAALAPAAHAAPRLFTLSGPTMAADAAGGVGRVAISPLRVSPEVASALPFLPRIELDLPGGLFEAERTLEDAGAPGAWAGKLLEADGSLGGDVVLAAAGDALHGIVYASYHEVYEIRRARGGGHVLALIDQSVLPDCGGSPRAPGRAIDEATVGAEAKQAPPEIRVLVVYTAAARDAVGGQAAIEALAATAVAETNTAYKNSKTKGKQVLAAAVLVNHKDGNDFSKALKWVSADKNVANLRKLHKADLVILYFDTPTDPPQFCGLGFLITSAAGGKFGFSVTEAKLCAVANGTHAHETGHNLGLQHNPEDSSSKGLDAFSHGHFSVAGNWITIMSYRTHCPGCAKSLNYSNPKVSIGGIPSGIANQRDNAKTLKKTQVAAAKWVS
jgi:hypothetical protein